MLIFIFWALFVIFLFLGKYFYCLTWIMLLLEIKINPVCLRIFYKTEDKLRIILYDLRGKIYILYLKLHLFAKIYISVTYRVTIFDIFEYFRLNF